ncbi:GNAT family N-acetyltransferase [Shouchella patagoniensis]|uniref:GNAT family N-acetyltransferase n=1 Tax=Shouchella patagoniensis TaxID=228576 RepID=UPI000995784C|nr:GNAT family N-acetyltransferase [Shouchella patagoniensis]
MNIIKSDQAHYILDENNNRIAEITYVESDESFIIIDHTFVDESLRGQGIASKLVASVVEEMKKQNKKIVPLCPFAKAEFDRVLDYQSMLK